MSKHHHSITAHEITFFVKQIKSLTQNEVKSLYGIDILQDEKVYDPMYDKTFESVSEWAAFNIEQDDVQYEEHFSKAHNDLE